MAYRIFDFFCEECRCTVEAMVPFGNDDVPACPVCDAEMVRLMPAPVWKWGQGARDPQC